MELLDPDFKPSMVNKVRIRKTSLKSLPENWEFTKCYRNFEKKKEILEWKNI